MSIVTSTDITRTCYWSQCCQPRLHRLILAPRIGTNSRPALKRRRTLTAEGLSATRAVSHLQGSQQPQQQCQLRPPLQHQQLSHPSHQAAVPAAVDTTAAVDLTAAAAAAAAAVTASPDQLLLNALNFQSSQTAVPATVKLSVAAPAVPAPAALPAAPAAAKPDQLPLIASVDRHLSQNTTLQVGDSAHLVSRTKSSSGLFINLEDKVALEIDPNSESASENKAGSKADLLESHLLNLGSPSSGRRISTLQRGIFCQDFLESSDGAEIVTVPTMATTTAAPPPPAAAAVPAAPAAAAAAGGGLLGGSAAAVVDKILATATPLSQITQVRMVMDSKCKMGISFWPMFSFKPPERDEKAGSAKLVHSTDVPPEMTAAVSSSSSGEVPSVSSQLLHVNFTQDPPDEFSVGAKFLGGVPFPFITIRTTKLEGTIDPDNGAVVLLFEAQFLAGVGKKEPTALTVNAHLTTEPATAFKTKMEGNRMENGRVTLVSAAEVPKTSSWFANILLWLPTAATAKLPMKLEFS